MGCQHFYFSMMTSAENSLFLIRKVLLSKLLHLTQFEAILCCLSSGEEARKMNKQNLR